MRLLRAFAAAVVCIAATAPWLAEARAGVRVAVSYETYRVEGDSLAAVWRDISRKAPRALRNGLHAQAEARIRYRWTAGYVTDGQGCAATRPGVSVRVTILTPEWAGAAAAPPAVRRAWQRYIAAVMEHEEQHRAIAEETGRALYAHIAGAPRHRSCRALARQIDSGIDAIMAEERRRQRHFDRIAPPIRLN